MIRLRERERAAKLTDAVLKELGLGHTQFGRFATPAAARLLAAVEPATKALGPSPWPLFDRYPFGPVVDGTIVPRHPFDPDTPDLSDDIPLLVGDTKDEASLFLSQDDKVWEGTLTEAELRERVAAVAGEHTDRVVATYRRVYPEEPGGAADRHATDFNFRVRSLTMAERRARKSRAGTFMYSFAWETPAFGGRLKSPHAMDVPFTFETVHLLAPSDRNEQAFALAAKMAGTWAAFARTGMPDCPAIPRWPDYTLERRATLILDENCRVEDDPGGKTRALWQEIAAS